MEIKEFSTEYVSDVAEIEKSCFSNPWSKTVLEGELKNDCSHIYVAVEQADIIRVAVLPEYRRQGIAEKLLLKSFEVNETDAIFLDVRESNLPAINLYKLLGFVDTGIRKDYYSNPTENAVLMKKEF